MAREFDDPLWKVVSAITINGVESGLKARGFHVVMLSATDGEVSKKNVFDTFKDASASREMIQFIDSSPDGSIIIIAVVDTAHAKLTQDARKYIASLGSRHVADLDYRETLALVTSKGVTRPPWFAENKKAYRKGPSSLDVTIWLQ